jgi:hypothetical protein
LQPGFLVGRREGICHKKEAMVAIFHAAADCSCDKHEKLASKQGTGIARTA